MCMRVLQWLSFHSELIDGRIENCLDIDGPLLPAYAAVRFLCNSCAKGHQHIRAKQWLTLDGMLVKFNAPNLYVLAGQWMTMLPITVLSCIHGSVVIM